MSAGLEYVGVRPCGCVTAWLSGDAAVEQIRCFYRDMEQSGREVRRMLADEAGARLVIGCPHISETLERGRR